MLQVAQHHLLLSEVKEKQYIVNDIILHNSKQLFIIKIASIKVHFHLYYMHHILNINFYQENDRDLKVDKPSVP